MPVPDVVTRSSMVAVPPLRIPPRFATMIVVPETEPWLTVAEASVRPAGSVSRTTTFVAAPGPLLLMNSV